MGNKRIAALSKVSGLTQLSLFGGKLGGEQGESMCEKCSAGGGDMRHPVVACVP
jgi:hypothetical protein